jgi:Flp pilus assembly protein TadD
MRRFMMRKNNVNMEGILIRRIQEAYALDSFHHARMLWQNGDIDGALEELDAATIFHPSNPEAFVLRGILLAKKGRKMSAQNEIRFALTLGGKRWKYAPLVRETLKKVEGSAA